MTTRSARNLLVAAQPRRHGHGRRALQRAGAIDAAAGEVARAAEGAELEARAPSSRPPPTSTSTLPPPGWVGTEAACLPRARRRRGGRPLRPGGPPSVGDAGAAEAAAAGAPRTATAAPARPSAALGRRRASRRAR
ncbi:unnamed protein product, partial [Prorocentrum cordatum]